MGGMRVSQNGLGWGGREILRDNGGDAKKGGDDLRIGGMTFLLTVFFEKLDMQGALPIISVCFTSELSRLLLSQYFQLNIALNPYITLKIVHYKQYLYVPAIRESRKCMYSSRAG